MSFAYQIQTFWFYASNVVEICILSFIIYYVLYYLRGTRSANILAGIIIAIILLTFLTEFLKFKVLNWLLNGLWAVFPIVIVIIFQPELRRAFAQIGARRFARRQRKEETISEVIKAVKNLSARRIGALIVFQRQIGIRALISNGEIINAEVSSALIESIFHPGTPLHDGGIAIDNEDRIAAAHIIFPLSQSSSVSKSLGTRHRAAVGITEETDVVAVVVSEETGGISLACRGALRRDLSPEKLSRYLYALLIKQERDSDYAIFDSDGEEDFSDAEDLG